MGCDEAGLINKIHETAIKFTQYEKSFVEYFLGDIFKLYIVKPIKYQRYFERYKDKYPLDCPYV